MSSDGDLEANAADGAASADDSEPEPEPDPDPEALRARIEALEDDTERLRRELSAARRSSYRRTALWMAVLGLAAGAGAALFPDARTVLLALAGTGLFGAVLIYYLTPERFVAASVGESVYRALSTNLEAIAADLELSDTAVYVPVDGDPGVRLYLPDLPIEAGGLPDASALADTFVVAPDARGLSLEPTGDPLRREFEETASPLPEAPEDWFRAAADALVEQFELVGAADADIDPVGGRASVRVTDSAYGPVDGFDHPVASFLASTLAAGLGRPVELEVEATDDAYVVTCRWEPADAIPENGTSTADGDGQPA